MPELREVFEMVTKQTEPDLDAWREQEQRHRRAGRNRKLGAFAVAAGIGLVAVVVIIRAAGDGTGTQPAVQPTPPSGAYTIDLDTGGTTPLPETLQGGDTYQVSADGTMLAYTRLGRLYVADVDGTGVREVPTGAPEVQGPSWSEDGSMLVFQEIGLSRSDRDLFVVDLATDEVRQITNLEHRTAWWWYMPSFGPDGETVLFHLPRRSDTGVRWDLWSVPVTGGEPALVLRDAAMGVYAPDGGTIAYVDAPRSEDGSGWSSSLWLRGADGGPGGDPRLLVDRFGHLIRWSPDGTKIAFSGSGEIHVVDVATGETSHVVDGGGADWLDDDTLLVTPEG